MPARSAPRRRAPPRGQRGIALILVLWLTMMLTVIASGFAFSMRSEAMSARNGLSLAQARATANGAIERMAFELSRPRFPTSWMADGQVHTWQDGDVSVSATAVDESARIDLNMAPETLLKGLMERVGGAEPDVATRIVESAADWRDPDDTKRPNGAEEADYRLAGLKQKPANAPFETVNELARVAGMTEAIFTRVADHLTVQSRQPGVNAMTASREVLLSLPNATPESVDAYLQQRADALANKLPVPPFPAASGFAAGAVPVWRIRAEATTADGVTFARSAVVRPSGDARRPLVALTWQDGVAPAPSSTGAPPTDASMPATQKKPADGRT